MTDQTPTPGSHLGPLPADEQILASMQAMQARGYTTTLASTWWAMELAGIEPDEFVDLAGLT